MKKGYDETEAKMCMIASHNANRDWKGVWDHSTNDPGDYAFIQKNEDGSYLLAFHGTDFKSLKNLVQITDVYKWAIPSFKINTKLKPKVSFAVDSAFLYFQSSLSDYLESLPFGTNFYVTGHSEGGAIAAIITLFISEKFKGKFNLKTYAFAPPTSGNQAFKTLVEEAASYGFYRIVNPNDIVPFFCDGILELIKENLPIKIPILIKGLFLFIHLLLKILRKKYIRIGETHLLAKKTFSSCLSSNLESVSICSSKMAIVKYECYCLCAHETTSYLDLMGVPKQEIEG
jgi:hypothetical protein